MCFWASFIAYAMRNCLSMTITRMVKDPPKQDVLVQDTCPDYVFENSVNNNYTSNENYEWNEAQQVNNF